MINKIVLEGALNSFEEVTSIIWHFIVVIAP
jgi:hypothetical protein